MTLTASRLRSQSSSRLRWVPAAAGWTVGVIATLSLITSVSPVIRWLIRVPREFINDYVFNFPDTSFAWSFVLALLAGALTARKRIAWWLLVFDATSAPADGAVTPAKCFAYPAGTLSASYGFSAPPAFTTGIVLSVSTTGCFTKTASVHAFLGGDYQ